MEFGNFLGSAPPRSVRTSFPWERHPLNFGIPPNLGIFGGEVPPMNVNPGGNGIPRNSQPQFGIGEFRGDEFWREFPAPIPKGEIWGINFRGNSQRIPSPKFGIREFGGNGFWREFPEDSQFGIRKFEG